VRVGGKKKKGRGIKINEIELRLNWWEGLGGRGAWVSRNMAG